MADVHDKKTRSYNMSRIRSKDTKPEIIVRRFLFSQGFRYRLHVKSLPGKPDIVLPKYNVIIDIRGCAWHGHKKCKFGDKIKSDSIHFVNRVKSAIMRDRKNIKEWKKLGWKVIIVWDRCELEDKKKYSKIREERLSLLKQQILN